MCSVMLTEKSVAGQNVTALHTLKHTHTHTQNARVEESLSGQMSQHSSHKSAQTHTLENAYIPCDVQFEIQREGMPFSHEFFKRTLAVLSHSDTLTKSHGEEEKKET